MIHSAIPSRVLLSTLVRPKSMRAGHAGPDRGQNGAMPDALPWSRLRSEMYALIGRNPRTNRMVPAIADLAPEHVVLDIGCGPGAAVRVAAPMVSRAVGVDRSQAMVEIAMRRSKSCDNVEFEVGGAERLPFGDGEFDRVWTIHSFHHWEDPQQGIAEAFRVLRSGGKLLIVENETKGAHGLNAARAESVAGRLRAAGFADTAVAKVHRQLVVTGEIAG